ncbi:MAG TPA: methyltransferase domain-containing protein [Pyrinomonadaceae bacterium]|jgi:SAM-dependent methyltransferase
MQEHTYAIMYEVEGAHWWFAGRRRILESFLDRLAPTLPAARAGARARVLDVGCGTGANLEMLARYGDAEGVDLSPAALAFCRARGLTQVTEGAAEALPYSDETFDLVTALDVVEHLDDDVAGLSEMRRVLKPGGCALLFVPAFQWLWGVQDDVSNHRRRYTRTELCRAVTAAGLSVERATYANVTFLAPILFGRWLMRATGARPASENNLNVAALNGLLGRVLGAERHWLRRANLPVGVSAICVARRAD